MRRALVCFCLVGSIPVATAIFLLYLTSPIPAQESSAEKAEPEKSAEASTAAEEKKYPEQKPELGAIEGRIILEGPPPAVAPIDVTKSNKDHKACVKHVKNEILTLSDKKEVKDVVISIDSYKPTKKPKPRDIVVDNRHCSFVPHVQATTRNSKLTVLNSDKFLHNSRGVLAASFNFAIPAGGKFSKRLRKPGWVILKCDFHPWMTAHVQVFTHDLFDVTSEDGAFKIPNVPPGEYDLHVWHERLAPIKGRVIKTKVKVEAGKTVKLDLPLSAPKK